MEENFGPKLEIIPEQRYYSCHGCKYYSLKMFRSGQRTSEFSSHCVKMDIFANVLNDEQIKINVNPYPIFNEKTPNECPFLIGVKREDNLNNILEK